MDGRRRRRRKEEEEEEEEEEEIVGIRKGLIVVTVVWLLKKFSVSTLFGEITKKQTFMCDANFAVDCCV